MIKALIEEIATLKAQLAQLIAERVGAAVSNHDFIPPGQIGKIACIELNRDLREGDSGDDVVKLQQFLASDSSAGFDASTTGFFGPLTARAMMHFQIEHGIVSSESETDGSVGPMTMGFFHRSCGKGLSGRHGHGHFPMMQASSTSNDEDSSMMGGEHEHENGDATTTDGQGSERHGHHGNHDDGADDTTLDN